jgi:malate dehydrogenase (oxaloacetate-decarboxylating)
MALDIIKLSKKYGGKIEIKSKFRLNSDNLPVLYTPGVAKLSRLLSRRPALARDYTFRKNSVAIVSNGSAVLGLGNLGALGALPVMEGKALLFNELAGIDAVPLVLNTQQPAEIINFVKNVAPTFGGINLEDISAPHCFEIEEKLRKLLDIPVFHDDQHGTAVVLLAGLINAVKLTGKKKSRLKVVISGAGAAGTAIAQLLKLDGINNIIVCDRHGAIYSGRRQHMNKYKRRLAAATNPARLKGPLQKILKQADIFIGVSAPRLLTADMVRAMSARPIIFAMSNPEPEIMPREAKRGGAFVIATGRSDYPNQINNLLAFPGIFRGALDKKAKQITDKHKLRAAYAIASLIKRPQPEKIIPSALNKKVVKAVADVF